MYCHTQTDILPYADYHNIIQTDKLSAIVVVVVSPVALFYLDSIIHLCPFVQLWPAQPKPSPCAGDTEHLCHACLVATNTPLHVGEMPGEENGRREWEERVGGRE